MPLWLRHTTGMTTDAERFDELSIDERDVVERRITKTLRGNTADHLLSSNRKWVVVISADETFGATSTKRDFLRAFFKAAERELALDDDLTEPMTGWIAVALEGGETPFENVEDNDLMPEYTLTMIEKGAS